MKHAYNEIFISTESKKEFPRERKIILKLSLPLKILYWQRQPPKKYATVEITESTDIYHTSIASQ